MDAIDALKEAISRYRELDQQGLYEEAEPYARIAAECARLALGPNHVVTAITANNLGEVLRELGRYSEAEPLYLDAIAVLDPQGNLHDYASVLNNLALCHCGQERWSDAELAYQEALKMQRSAREPEDWAIANTLYNYALLYKTQGDWSQAVDLFSQALRTWEDSADPDKTMIAQTVHQIGRCLTALGRYDEAEPFYERSCGLLAATHGPVHLAVADAWTGRAENSGVAGRLDEAARAYRMALAIYTDCADDSGIALASGRLGELLLSLGRDETEAARLLLRSVLLNAAKSDFSALEIQQVLTDFYLLLRLAKDSLAQEHVRILAASCDKIRSALAESNPTAAFVDGSLAYISAQVAELQGDDELKMRLYIEALERLGRASSAITVGQAGVLASLASAFIEAGDFSRAVEAAENAQSILLAALGREHPVSWMISYLLAHSHLQLRRTETALRHSRQAVKSVGAALLRFDDPTVVSEFHDARFDAALFLHMRILQAASADGTLAADEVVSDAFEVAQLVTYGPIARSFSRMCARLVDADLELRGLARKRQDALREMRAKGDRLLEAQSGTRAPELQSQPALAADIERLSAWVAELDLELRNRSPTYASIAAWQLSSLSNIQAQLADDEALLAYLIACDGSFLVAIRSESAEVVKLAVDEGWLESTVTELRRDLDPSIVPRQPFRSELAFDLYQRLLLPVEHLLKGVVHLYVVPHGPISAIPLSVWVTQPPDASSEPIDYCGIAWLANRFSVSVLPNPSSLGALRATPTRQRGELPFIGFGDPVIPDTLLGNPTTEDFCEPDHVDIEALGALQRLPETARELGTIAKLLGASDDSVVIGAAATKGKLNSVSLSRYRVVIFSTHSLLPGDVPGLKEPALVLSPEVVSGKRNDGLLRASEIAALDLNADWVVLSACDTADSRHLGHEGVASLAEAFFFAGARSVVVSQWKVDSESTELLITGIFRELVRSPSLAGADAVRRAMRAAMLSKGGPEDFSHPALWAPFVVIGDRGC